MQECRPDLAATGITGLDLVLDGGIPRDRTYLVEGNPGAGKTTLALQFLLEGLRRGEPVLYVTLSETRDELLAVAASHGWSLEGMCIHEAAIDPQAITSEGQYTLFHPAELELGNATQALLEQVERTQPSRAVFDSLSEMRLLARDALRYRRQILGLKQYFAGRRCTVMLLDDGTADESDMQLRSLAHGVISLEHLAFEYGAERRRLRVLKLRGRAYRGGFHDFTIRTGGLEVFPRPVPIEQHAGLGRERVQSGVTELDRLLGGGLERGSSALVIGPAGSGKSTLAVQYAAAAAARGERAVLFLFDEDRDTLLRRAEGMGIALGAHLATGRVAIEQIDPGEIAPGEFVCRLLAAVEKDGAKVVVIDSLNGYLNAMPEERFLIIQLHEVLTHLTRLGVVTLIVAAQHGMIGAMQAPVDVSYLADAVLLLRYFEAGGHIRQALSVMKKRGGPHERTIREYQLGSQGIRVGEPLAAFRGVLTGTPQYQGEEAGLFGGASPGGETPGQEPDAG